MNIKNISTSLDFTSKIINRKIESNHDDNAEEYFEIRT